LRELRAGKIGRVSLEGPGDIVDAAAAGVRPDQEPVQNPGELEASN